jgi:hypothetical protein
VCEIFWEEDIWRETHHIGTGMIVGAFATNRMWEFNTEQKLILSCKLLLPLSNSMAVIGI